MTSTFPHDMCDIVHFISNHLELVSSLARDESDQDNFVAVWKLEINISFRKSCSVFVKLDPCYVYFLKVPFR